MNYFVTFCAADSEVGANPMWHSSLLLSQWEPGLEKVEVVHNWGFNPMPSEKSGWFNLLWATVFESNHGFFIEEATRSYDRGRGLHGVTFEITKEQFDSLEKQWSKIITDQNAAIKEIVEPLGIQGKSEANTKFYSYEEFSKAIYKFELAKAKQEGRESRLKTFESCFSWRNGTIGSQNCKTQALNFLSSVLSEEQINRLTEQGNHPTFPRWSGRMEELFLHSQGPLRTHQKASGDIAHYRDTQKDKEAKLYWTLPPQELETLSEETKTAFFMDQDYCLRVKPRIRQLQSLEWLFRDTILPLAYQPYKELVLAQLTDFYQLFANLKEKPKPTKASDLAVFALTLFSAPKEQTLLTRIDAFLNSLYMAITDGWTIDTDYPPEDLSLTQLTLDDSQEEAYRNPLEAVAHYLPLKDKKKLCEILGRSYCESEWDLALNATL